MNCQVKIYYKLYVNKYRLSPITVLRADPGFPVGGSINPPGWGSKRQICQIFPETE